MEKSGGEKVLEFACECLSGRGGYSDPWAAIAQNRLFADGTKELVLNQVAQEPKTIAQIAKALTISQPTIHTHVNDMMASELLRESEDREKRYPTERYYEPNFLIVKAEQRAKFDSLCHMMAEQVAGLFEKKRGQLELAFQQTTLEEHGWEFSDVAQYLFASVQRGARHILEERGTLPPRQKHKNGVNWVFWAEETNLNNDK
jgi:DNA-binding transcriptional ArsR family regulator